MASLNSSPVFTPGTISTKGISGAGLKKCNPPKRSGCVNPLERAAILKLEVFVHSQASERSNGST